jgi:hypothetical protein
MGQMALVVADYWQAGADGATLASQLPKFVSGVASPSLGRPVIASFGRGRSSLSLIFNLMPSSFFLQQRHPTSSKRQVLAFMASRSIPTSRILTFRAWPSFDPPNSRHPLSLLLVQDLRFRFSHFLYLKYIA